MAHFFWRALQGLWSCWAVFAGLALFAALWQAGSEEYGAFILPDPLLVIMTAFHLLSDSESWFLIFQTLSRAIEGYMIAVFVGAVGGMMAGFFPALMRLSRPVLMVLMGVPPIAWIVLTMIWFGSSDEAVTVTIAVAAMPLLFVTTAEGILTQDPKLDEMAQVFGVSKPLRLWTISLRHVTSFLFPVLGVSLGSAIKIAMMAEVLSYVGGMGGALATARVNLEIAEALAWILLAVAALIAIDGMVLKPLQMRLERWRKAQQPWGIRS